MGSHWGRKDESPVSEEIRDSWNSSFRGLCRSAFAESYGATEASDRAEAAQTWVRCQNENCWLSAISLATEKPGDRTWFRLDL